METKNREKLLLIATGACVALWLLNLFVISPLTTSWKGRSKQISDLHKQIADGHLLVRRQDSILGRWSRMNTNALANTPTVAERQLFEAFNRWVNESGVTQGSFKPQLKETDDGYSTEDCRADVTGTIQSIVRFLYDVEKDPMAVRLQGVEITSRDDTGKQLSLGLDLSGLLQPPPDPLLINIGEVASMEETNSNPELSWTNFQTLAQKNIFDPSRTGRIRFNNLARRAPVVLAFTFGGTVEDGPTNFVALFSGEGTRRGGVFKAGDALNGFKVRQISLHAVTLTDPAGNTVMLNRGEGMRREGDDPWKKSDLPAPVSMAGSGSAPGEAVAAPSAGPAGESEVLKRLRLKREQEDK